MRGEKSKFMAKLTHAARVCLTGPAPSPDIASQPSHLEESMPSVAEVVAQTLKAYGTEKFFCFMGGDHEFWYALQDAGIELINCRSEAGAVYMADGYARVSGKPGYVYGQRGPGVSNVAGALADGWWAKSPVISLTSSIPMDVRDRFEYQELDGLPLHVGVTKWNKTVSTPERAGAMVRAAIRQATGAPPGPVHLEIPADMLTKDASDDDIYRDEDHGHVNSRRVTPDREQLRKALEILLSAERPLIVAGKGVIISEAWAELTRFAETYGIPVATSLGGKGAISEMHDLGVGVIGRNSRRVGNDTVRGSDAILAIGTRLGGLATHRWHLPFGEKRLTHIDPDPQILGHNVRTEVSVVGDAKLSLLAALEIGASVKRNPAAAKWAEKVKGDIRAWRANVIEHEKKRFEDGINQAYDHYNAYAFHFYGLMWARLHHASDEARATRWRDWAKLFVADYAHFFAATPSSRQASS